MGWAPEKCYVTDLQFQTWREWLLMTHGAGSGRGDGRQSGEDLEAEKQAALAAMPGGKYTPPPRAEPETDPEPDLTQWDDDPIR